MLRDLQSKTNCSYLLSPDSCSAFRHKRGESMKKDLTRRQFLHKTAAASAIAAANSVFLRDTRLEAASYRAVPPTDRLRFGIIGVGMEGSGVLQNALALPGVECVAAADLYD